MNDDFQECWYGEPNWSEIDDKMVAEAEIGIGLPIPISKHVVPRGRLRFVSDQGPVARDLKKRNRLWSYEQAFNRKKMAQWVFDEDEVEVLVPTEDARRVADDRE